LNDEFTGKDVGRIARSELSFDSGLGAFESFASFISIALILGSISQ
jgi:hypothetical protein